MAEDIVITKGFKFLISIKTFKLYNQRVRYAQTSKKVYLVLRYSKQIFRCITFEVCKLSDFLFK